MNPSRFDELTKALATATSRRQALKAIGAAIGGAMGLGSMGTAFAKNCKQLGQGCNNKKNLCCPGLLCQGGMCVAPTTTTTPAPTTTTTTPAPTTTTTTPAPTTTTTTTPPPCVPLSNGSCATPCTGVSCSGCFSCFYDNDGSKYCQGVGGSAASCTSDSGCPRGEFCAASGLCEALCTPS